MTQNRIEYEGRMAGDWRLDSFLGTRDGMAVYDSSSGSGGFTPERKAVVKLLMLDDERSGAVRSSWEQATKCVDDHLVRVYETGEAELDGRLVIFAAMEPSDIGVEEILAGRPVSVDEARSLVAGVAGALEYLHQRGLQHGSVIPSHMHVAGDAVKLSADTISTASEDGWKSDMRQLGTTLIHAMTGVANGGNASLLPRPFQAIATGCLGAAGRPWTAHRVLQTLSGIAIADPELGTMPPVVRRLLPAQPAPMRWPFVAMAAVVLFGILGYWGLREPAKQAAQVASVPVAAPVAESTRARTVAPPAKSAASKSGWAVIAATYVSRQAAEGRAVLIAKRSPGVRAHVFTSSSGSRMSYVLLGAGLTREEADRVLRAARQAGAPRDSYVTKLMEK